MRMSNLYRSLRRRPEISDEIYCIQLSENHGADMQPAEPEPEPQTAPPAKAAAPKTGGGARPGKREQAVAESNATLRKQNRRRRLNLLCRSAGDTFNTTGPGGPKKTSPKETQ